MADRIDALEKKVDRLTVTVDDLLASVDRRFDAVDLTILEQRQYTEFAYT